MNCPKCGYENQAERQDCLRCGVIFSKIRKEHPVDTPARESEGIAGESLWEGVLHAPSETGRLQLLGRGAVLVVLLVWGGKLIISGVNGNAAGESLLHLVNLPFHEFGHILFRPLGTFFTSLGGTLAQLLIPLICTAVLLLKTRDPFGAAVGLWWFGENFLDIAPYINDARAGELPLLGGNTGSSSPYGFHDWEFLLTETGLLRYDHSLAWLAHVFGSLIMILAVVWAGMVVFRQRRNLSNTVK